MRIKYFGLLLLVTFMTRSSEEVARPAEVLRLDAVLQKTLSGNPALAAARAQWESIKERVPQARAWDDPRVGVDVERSGSTRFGSYSDAEWMVSQTLPVTGKNRTKGKIVESEAAQAWEQVRRKELDLALRARLAYYRYANAAEQIRINEKNLRLLKQFADASRSKYEVGTRSQADVLAAETERAKLAETTIDLHRNLADAQSRLNTLMNQPPAAPLLPPEPLSIVPFPALTFGNLEQLAKEHRPEIKAARIKVAEAENRVKLAKKELWPDPELRVEARQLNAAGGAIKEYDTGIFVDVPWVNRGKYKARIREMEKARESAAEDLASMELELAGQLREQLTKIETFHHHTQIYSGHILALAEQTLSSTRLSYETDKSSLLDLLMAQRSVQDAEAMYWNHVLDYLSSLAELEALVGASSK